MAARKHVQRATLTIGANQYKLVGDIPVDPTIDEEVEETEVPPTWDEAAAQQYTQFIYGVKTRGTISFTLAKVDPFVPPVTKCKQAFGYTFWVGEGECGETPDEVKIPFYGVITERRTGTVSIDGERMPTVEITVRVQEGTPPAA